MKEHNKHDNTVRVENYGLPEWITEVVELAKEGYTFDLESNERTPTRFGTMYTCVMIPPTETQSTSAMIYMEGYTAGKEWGLAQGSTKLVEGGGLITEITPVDVVVEQVDQSKPKTRKSKVKDEPVVTEEVVETPVESTQETPAEPTE